MADANAESRTPRTGLEQAFWRLVHSQSALAIRDVMCLAVPKGRAAELASIYEWYATRTASAIRTSYAAATAAVVALLAYIRDDGDEWATITAFGLVIALALVVCAFQQAELAQLPRERAVAMHLLAIFEQLATAKPPLLEAPLTWPEDPQGFWTRGRIAFTSVAVAVIVLLILLLFVVVLPPEDSRLASVGVVLSAVVVLVFASRLASECKASPELPAGADGAVECIGRFRLDEYISDPAITELVNTRLEEAIAIVKASLTKAPGETVQQSSAPAEPTGSSDSCS